MVSTAVKASKKSKKKPVRLFQALGLIQPQIVLRQNIFYAVSGEKEYQLYFDDPYKQEEFKNFLESGLGLPILLVYPQITHFPEKNKPHQINFKVKAWNDNIDRFDIDLGEFKIKGLFQFLPCYKYPVISVFRNRNKKLTELVNSSEEKLAKRLLRVNHVPIMWSDSPVKPFRYRNKSKVQGDKYFVEVITKFNPQKNCFVVQKMDAEPTTRIPRYLKFQKKET